MRIIGTLSHENQARKLAHYLTTQGINNTFEPSFNALNGQMSYDVWIHDEDRLSDAAQIFEEFERHSSDPKFDLPPYEPPAEPALESEVPSPPSRRFKTYVTHFFLFLCSLLFFFNSMEELPLLKQGLNDELFMITPLQMRLLYDIPPPYDKIEQDLQQQPTATRPQIQTDLIALQKAPYWQGFYEWMTAKIQNKDTTRKEGPLFTRILRGEVWRLFTPCLLHLDLLHILFNMLWLWYLGRPIEQRIGPLRTLLLTLCLGIVTNTLQYLMSGPFFMGYSGIITALAGFIWMREKIAPWEGYPLTRGTLLFLFFFIGAIFLLQVTAFALQIFTSLDFDPKIANTAHLTGALLGALLARSPFFAQRVPS